MKFVLIFVLCGIVANSLADITKNVPQTVTFKIMNYWGCPLFEGEDFEEKTVSFTSLEDLFTKIPTTNLQKALFYLGFCPKEVFYPKSEDNRSFVFNHEWEFSYCYNEIPSDEMMLQNPKVVDAKKAFSMIVKSEHDLKCQHSAMSKPLLATMYLEGIGCEKNSQKAFELLKDNPTFNMSIEDIKAQKYDNHKYRLYHKASMFVVAYMYYYGLGVETDKAKSKAIIQSMDRYELWRNFYIGYLAPKNEEFAIFILECSDEFWTALELSKIYAGFYNKNRIDLEKSRFWQAEYEKRKQLYFKKRSQKVLCCDTNERLDEDNLNEMSKTLSSLKTEIVVRRALFFSLKSIQFSRWYKFIDIEFDNVYYNLQKANFYMNEVMNRTNLNYFNMTRGLNLFGAEIQKGSKIVEELQQLKVFLKQKYDLRKRLFFKDKY